MALSLAACGGGDDDGPPEQLDASIDAPADAPLDSAPACGGAQLCERTRGECMVNISEAACLAFYEPATTSCADITSYTACNCNCITQPTCTEYFDCGTTCHEDWC
jgi:hypothetical protein